MRATRFSPWFIYSLPAFNKHHRKSNPTQPNNPTTNDYRATHNIFGRTEWRVIAVDGCGWWVEFVVGECFG